MTYDNWRYYCSDIPETHPHPNVPVTVHQPGQGCGATFTAMYDPDKDEFHQVDDGTPAFTKRLEWCFYFYIESVPQKVKTCKVIKCGQIGPDGWCYCDLGYDDDGYCMNDGPCEHAVEKTEYWPDSFKNPWKTN